MTQGKFDMKDKMITNIRDDAKNNAILKIKLTKKVA